MTDLDAAFESVKGGAVTVAPSDLASFVDNLQPVVEVIRQTVIESPIFALRWADASPDQRAEITRARRILHELVTPLNLRLKALDEAVKIAHAKTNAREFAAGDEGKVKVEAPTQKWRVNGQGMRNALLELVDTGAITRQEIDQALKQVIDYEPDNVLLNHLAKTRGDAVAEAINSHRSKPDVDPSRMKVEWPK